jgi:hypothetical protein
LYIVCGAFTIRIWFLSIARAVVILDEPIYIAILRHGVRAEQIIQKIVFCGAFVTL